MQRPSRYAELRAAIPDITDRMLSERLRELEDEAIVARTVIPETPVRVEYSLTSKGRALAPALDAIGHWAEKWVEAGDPPKAAAPAGRTTRRKPVAAAARRRSEPRPCPPLSLPAPPAGLAGAQPSPVAHLPISSRESTFGVAASPPRSDQRVLEARDEGDEGH